MISSCIESYVHDIPRQCTFPYTINGIELSLAVRSETHGLGFTVHACFVAMYPPRRGRSITYTNMDSFVRYCIRGKSYN